MHFLEAPSEAFINIKNFSQNLFQFPLKCESSWFMIISSHDQYIDETISISLNCTER